MLLVDLHPAIVEGVLLFDCPNPEHKHRIRVPVSAETAVNGVWWQLTGSMAWLTARNPNGQGPHSLDFGECLHMTLTNGVMI